MGEELSAARLGELVKDFNAKQEDASNHVKQRGASSIDLPALLMTSFFKPLFDKIKGKVKELIEAAANEKQSPVNFIFMVGGFSESPYLKAVIKKNFEENPVGGNKLCVLVPRRPQVSVIRGACLFGLNPRSITSRISKLTYGINTLTTYDPARHAEEKKVVIEGEDFCEDVFDAFVKRGEAVGIDEVHVKTYCPVRARQTVMRIIFYCTEKEGPQFVDEEAVK